MTKSLEDLRPEDFQAHAVWRLFQEEDLTQERTIVRPVLSRPVTSLDNCLVGTLVSLSNGSQILAMMGNIDLGDRKCTDQFVTVSAYVCGRWVHLARYFDVDYARNGPAAFAAALGLRIEEVFPIHYDFRSLVGQSCPVASGDVHAEPREVLSSAEIADLAVNGSGGGLASPPVPPSPPPATDPPPPDGGGWLTRGEGRTMNDE